MITCAHCDRVVSGEKKHKTSPDGTKREYVYYRCSGYAADDHPRTRLTEAQIDEELRRLYASIQLDEEAGQWLLEMIRTCAHSGQAKNKQHRAELQRQHTQVEAKLSTLLELRMEGEISSEEYSAKRAELHDRQSALRVKLERSDRDDREIADLAIKAFELSQNLQERWLTAEFDAKRQGNRIFIG